MPRVLWNWSKEAVRAFFVGASSGGGRMNARAGMDRALLEDLELLTPALTAFWVEQLTGPGVTPRRTTIHAKGGTFLLDEAGNASIDIPLTEKFLRDLLALPPREDPDAPGDEPAVRPEDPTPAAPGDYLRDPETPPLPDLEDAHVDRTLVLVP